jgi:hypothetical protein
MTDLKIMHYMQFVAESGPGLGEQVCDLLWPASDVPAVHVCHRDFISVDIYVHCNCIKRLVTEQGKACAEIQIITDL